VATKGGRVEAKTKVKTETRARAPFVLNLLKFYIFKGPFK